MFSCFLEEIAVQKWPSFSVDQKNSDNHKYLTLQLCSEATQHTESSSVCVARLLVYAMRHSKYINSLLNLSITRTKKSTVMDRKCVCLVCVS